MISKYMSDDQEQQQMAGMASQTGTSHSSLATPPSTVQPVRQSSMAPPTQRMTSQPSHQLSVSSAARCRSCGQNKAAERKPAPVPGVRLRGPAAGPSAAAVRQRQHPAWPAASAELHQREPGIAGLSGRNAAVHTAIQITSGTPADPATASAQAYHEQTGVPIRTHSSLSLLSNVCFLLCGISIQTFGKLFFDY